MSKAATPVLVVLLAVLSAAPASAGEAPPLARNEWAIALTVVDLIPSGRPPRADPGPSEPCRPDSPRPRGEEFPAQSAAAPHQSDHWAVLVGINDYVGGVSDTVGSVPDALQLCDVLLAQGWRRDHILVLTDRDATRDRIAGAFAWLTRKTGGRSTVVVSYSGHMQHEGDGPGTDAALWPADNAYIWSADLGRMLAPVDAGQMWVTLQGCHAGGLAAPGVEGPGRIVTYSSPADDKSYDDLSVGFSVQGRYLFREGLGNPRADRDGDGAVSVQEAHRWLVPRALERTAGRQHPFMIDRLGEPLLLSAM